MEVPGGWEGEHSEVLEAGQWAVQATWRERDQGALGVARGQARSTALEEFGILQEGQGRREKGNGAAVQSWCESCLRQSLSKEVTHSVKPDQEPGSLLTEQRFPLGSCS